MTVDDTTVARFAGTAGTPTWAASSASFTPANNSLLVATVEADTLDAAHGVTVTVSGGSLTWTKRAEQNAGTNGGEASVWTAPVATGASMTVTAAAGGDHGSNRISCKVYIVTSHDTTTPTGSTGSGNGGTTNSITPSLFTAQTLGVAFVAGCEWNALGLPTSSDLTKDAAHYASQLDVLSGYKTIASTGAATTANLDASGTANAAWNWAAVEVRAAAATAPPPFHRSQRFFRRASGLILPLGLAAGHALKGAA